LKAQSRHIVPRLHLNPVQKNLKLLVAETQKIA
jgi:hypothetical protein